MGTQAYPATLPTMTYQTVHAPPQLQKPHTSHPYRNVASIRTGDLRPQARALHPFPDHMGHMVVDDPCDRRTSSSRSMPPTLILLFPGRE
jgi:hypothetical protein